MHTQTHVRIHTLTHTHTLTRTHTHTHWIGLRPRNSLEAPLLLPALRQHHPLSHCFLGSISLPHTHIFSLSLLFLHTQSLSHTQIYVSPALYQHHSRSHCLLGSLSVTHKHTLSLSLPFHSHKNTCCTCCAPTSPSFTLHVGCFSHT